MSDTTKVLVLVGSVIVICVLCAVGFKMTNEGKSAVNASANNFNNMTSQYQDIDKAIYDGATVMGSEVVNLIKKTEDKGSEEYLAIGVLTLKKKGSEDDSDISDSDYTYYHMKYTDEKEPLSDTSNEYSTIENNSNPESQPDYINPSAQFAGKVNKDENGLIICIQFTQLN